MFTPCIDAMKREIKDVILITERSIISVLYFTFRIFPIKRNKIVFCNFYGSGYGDNPKYIAEVLLKHQQDYDLVWLVKQTDKNIPSKIRQVKFGSLKAIYELVTAQVWVDNCTKDISVLKRKNQTYIATWHGGFAMKKIGFQNRSGRHIHGDYATLKDSRMADFFVSNSTFCTEELYRKGFRFEQDILEVGSPRNDILVNNGMDYGVRNAILNKMKLDVEKKYLLYAPTFRDNGSIDAFDIDIPSLIDALKRKFGGDWIFMIRLHPKNAEKCLRASNGADVVDVTKYDDMYELMVAADVLITDYSSTMFEMALTRKPVFLYVKDLEEYEKDRGVNFKIEELPYPSVKSSQELVKKVEGFNDAEYQKANMDFQKRLGVNETGHASESVAKLIAERCNC